MQSVTSNAVSEISYIKPFPIENDANFWKFFSDRHDLLFNGVLNVGDSVTLFNNTNGSFFYTVSTADPNIVVGVFCTLYTRKTFRVEVNIYLQLVTLIELS